MSVSMSVLQGIAVAMTRRELKKGIPSTEKARKPLDTFENSLRLARGVTVTQEVLGGVPVRRYSSGGTGRGVVLQLHGGAYIAGSSKFAKLYSRLAANGGPDIVGVDYRLAPEHPYPAAVDDALAVYKALGDVPVVVIGESAGGGLALSLVQRIRDELETTPGLRMPVGVVPLFPWADLTQGGSSWDYNSRKDTLDKTIVDLNAREYFPEGDLKTSGVSPLFGSFAGFPPTLLIVGTYDSLLEDSRRVAASMRESGVAVTLSETKGGVHSFIALPVPEGRKALAELYAFVGSRLATA